MAFEFDLEIRELRWVSAGLTKFWLASAGDAGAVHRLGSSLGANQDQRFETHRLPLSIGDSFYLCTDELMAILTERQDLPLDQYPQMIDLLQSAAQSGEHCSDLTAVCIHIESFPDSLFRREGWPKSLHFNGYGDYQRFKGEVAIILADITGKAHSIQEVAVHEALANAMECRDGVARAHRSRLRFNKVGNQLIVRIKTTRMGFAGNAVLRRLRSQPEDLFSYGEDSSMGRGIPLMLAISHKMLYNSEGTELLLAWKL
jgi:anti-sigma regulatory factor (Ser/Thr protein kinase)